MKNIDHEPYLGYPRFWTDEELNGRAIRAIQEEIALRKKMANLGGDEVGKSLLDVKVGIEAVRSAIESETRLMLLPIDMAIKRVALIDEDGYLTLKPEVVKNLQKLEK
jgi:hypothetical protein